MENSFFMQVYKISAKCKINIKSDVTFSEFLRYIYRSFLAVLINIQVIRHKSKANSHQNSLNATPCYPPTSTYTAAVKEPYREYLLCMAHFYLFSEIIATASDMQSFDYLINDRVFKHER